MSLEIARGLADSIRLQEQYQRNLAVLKVKGLSRYKPPSYQSILKRIAQSPESLERKINQGFSYLLVVPFAAGLDELMQAADSELRDRFVGENGQQYLYPPSDTDDDGEDGGETILMPDPRSILRDTRHRLIPLNVTNPVKAAGASIYDDEAPYYAVDADGLLRYYPDETRGAGSDPDDSYEKHGLSKARLVNPAEELWPLSPKDQQYRGPLPGWHVVLIEDMPNLPGTEEALKIGGRRQIPVGLEISPVLTMLQTDSAYRGELPMVPEEYIFYLLNKLHESNQIIDDKTGSILAGAFFDPEDERNESVREYPLAYWVGIGGRRPHYASLHPVVEEKTMYDMTEFDGEGGNLAFESTHVYNILHSKFGVRTVVRI